MRCEGEARFRLEKIEQQMHEADGKEGIDLTADYVATPLYSPELLFDIGIRASAQIPRNGEYNGVVDVDASDHIRKKGRQGETSWTLTSKR